MYAGQNAQNVVTTPARASSFLCAPRAGPLAVAQDDGRTASKGLRRGFFDRRPSKPVAPLPRTPAQKPGSRPAAQRSSLKQGSAASADAGPAQPPDVQRGPLPSFEQQQTAFTGA